VLLAIGRKECASMQALRREVVRRDAELLLLTACQTGGACDACILTDDGGSQEPVEIWLILNIRVWPRWLQFV
jgi:hypothetical protein